MLQALHDPGRKMFHLFGGLGLLAIYRVLGRHQALPVYAALFCLVLLFEILRLSVPRLNSLFISLGSGFVRPAEKGRITGMLAYISGVALSLFLYDEILAVHAVCFLAVGDVSATTVGERYGRIRIGKKSLEGSIAFLIGALAVGAILHLLGMGLMHGILLAGALTATAVELLPVRVNDNLTIPLAAGGVMQLLVSLTGCA